MSKTVVRSRVVLKLAENRVEQHGSRAIARWDAGSIENCFGCANSNGEWGLFVLEGLRDEIRRLFYEAFDAS